MSCSNKGGLEQTKMSETFGIDLQSKPLSTSVLLYFWKEIVVLYGLDWLIL
jgi:hypothetical protein